MMWVLAGIMIATVATCVLLVSNSSKMAEIRIRQDMLDLTPLGTSMDDVITIILRKPNSDIFLIVMIWDMK